MGQKIKNGLQNPIISRVSGISIGAVVSFSMVLGAYKESFDTMKQDVKFTKNSVQQITVDVAVLTTKLDEHIKK